MTPRILIIEDNEKNLILLRDLLEYHGYTVITARNGEEGVRLAQERHPDLILMDLQMPVLDGYGALEALRGDPALREVKVVAVTALAMRGDKKMVLRAGFDGYLGKPIDVRQLPATIKSYLSGGKGKQKPEQREENDAKHR